MDTSNEQIYQVYRKRMWQVYRLTCIVTGKSYVGKGIGKKRWIDHKRNARKNVQSHLCAAIRKYGTENFILTIENEFINEHEAYAFETEIITKENLTKTGYNEAPGMIVHIDCDLTNIKRAATTKKTWTQERRLKQSKQYCGNGNPFFGKHHDDETKKIMSECSKSNIKAHEKISQALTGRKHSDETKRKMSSSSPTKGKTLEETYGSKRAAQIKQNMKKSQPDRKGENHPSSKLTEADVLNIRKRSKNVKTDIELAYEFGVSTRTITKIRLRYSWKHIQCQKQRENFTLRSRNC